MRIIVALGIIASVSIIASRTITASLGTTIASLSTIARPIVVGQRAADITGAGGGLTMGRASAGALHIAERGTTRAAPPPASTSVQSGASMTVRRCATTTPRPTITIVETSSLRAAPTALQTVKCGTSTTRSIADIERTPKSFGSQLASDEHSGFRPPIKSVIATRASKRSAGAS